MVETPSNDDPRKLLLIMMVDLGLRDIIAITLKCIESKSVEGMYDSSWLIGVGVCMVENS